MGDGPVTSTSVTTIAAMVTPALLILGSASLVALALVRMARVVDRARTLAAIAQDVVSDPPVVTSAQLSAWLARHATRARYAETSIALLYSAIVLFIATCLSIAIDRIAEPLPNWMPVALSVAGTLLLFSGAGFMVAESRLSGVQIAEEIAQAIDFLEGKKP